MIINLEKNKAFALLLKDKLKWTETIDSETQLTQKDSEKLTTILTRFRYALFSPPLAFDPRAVCGNIMRSMTTCTALSAVYSVSPSHGNYR